ncbi:MobA/MobL family protein [Heyndrickxia sporothermodurans]|uniref:MobQ family relaxase n=1 Tax=Heyndrickxia sporothermodurans TaxID=46224 RepID=UPI002DBEDF5E|nr:MobQ family relaxase [Heyndrickxia sporothermodurans]MEB6551123.1 MobA/MobL family protein [Heyndrickxia sporothermodurans]
MAIYHFSAQVISRRRGQSAVAAAAYRSGERLTDERTGEEKYYRRNVEPDAMILAPSNSPEWVYNREQLWNEVESAEKRKDAQLSREINIALPVELSIDNQEELIRDYIQKEFVNRGMIADIAIHRDDPNNPHAHVMLTTRKITADGFGPKNREWNDRGLLEQWREEWANHTNQALEKENIQERISHLSHEARGLEQLPTIHLGHVAHKMEKRGIETDRGNMNRERQEYNSLVVDLQKYREEKQAIEQEKVRKEEQMQKTDHSNTYFTPSELVNLKEASKILKAEPTLTKIVDRCNQLDKWENRVNNGDQYLRWKDEKIREASGHHRWIHSFENKIQEAKKQIENISWINPLKIKENKSTKEQAERDILNAQKQIEFYNEKLNYHREKLGFQTEQEFNRIKNQHEMERPGLLEENQNARRQIHYERDILQKAENAHKNFVVRKVVSFYPERPEMHYMSYKTAINLVDLKKANGKFVPIESIEKTLNTRKQEIQRLQSEIARVDRNQSRLQRVKEYLKNYEKYQDIVEKYENNPFLKGKMLVSKSTKKEYDHAVSTRDQYKVLLDNENISGRTDFEKQTDLLGKMETKVPEYKGQIQSYEKGLGLLDAVINGIEQAGREMQRKQQREQQKENSKGNRKRKKRQNVWEMER